MAAKPKHKQSPQATAVDLPSTEVITVVGPTPETTARRANLIGMPVLMGGHEWVLDYACPIAGDVWDALYDDAVTRQRYDPFDLMAAAFVLLLRNYDLAPNDAYALILEADVQSLVSPVETALFGPSRKHQHATHGEWVRGSLWANGINPATLPPYVVRDVLNILVGTGRTLPEEDFITVHLAARYRKGLLNFGGR